LVLADEPTANLDSHASDELMKLFIELNQRHSTTFVIATHDQRVMGYAYRLIKMLDGRIIDDIAQHAA
ncbi:MAG: macrolide ABC transporter ATP-binding protein, partial [Woeseia sp.]